MPTQDEIVSMLRATYDKRDAAADLVKEADVEEEAIDKLIAQCGYDAFELVERVYREG
jgi:hypothetical protein